MKLTILLRRSRANRAAKTTKAGECCMGLLQVGISNYVRLIDPIFRGAGGVD